MVYYNPFDKPIGDSLDVDDLESLIPREVAEGYYIEYKSIFPDSNKIARSIASFANTYGGWYFIGIKTDGQNRAKEICGFDHNDYPDPLSRLLDPARQWISHMPLLYPQLIQIDETHSVVAVHIPEGLETPYITGDGRIYRRAADSSDPIPEKDRYSVDRLVDKGRKERERFADFCSDPREFSQSEDHIPWISIYFQPQPRGIIYVEDINEDESIQHLIDKSSKPIVFLRAADNGEEAVTANISPFDTSHPSGSSLVLRHVHQLGQAAFNSLTMQFFSDGAAKVHVPLEQITLQNLATSGITNSHLTQILFSIQNADPNTRLFKFVNAGNNALTCGLLANF